MTAKIQSPYRDALIRGRAWAINIEAIDPTGANDHFFFLNNDGSRTLELVAVGNLLSTVATAVEVHRAKGPATSGSAATIVPLGKTLAGPDGVTAETGVDLQVTLGDKLARINLQALSTTIYPQLWVPPIGILIPGGGNGLAFNMEAATGAVTADIYVIELPEDEDQ